MWWLPVITALSLALTSLVRRKALLRGILDHPNSRSSHSLPTPRGGGLSIVATATAAVAYMGYLSAADTALLLALVVGGLAVALVGYMDDRESLPIRARIAVHFLGATWAIYILGGLPAIQWGATLLHPGLVGNALAVVSIVWMLNLFNFMDGIDGLAASEAVFVTGAGAGLTCLGGVHSSVTAASLVVAAGSLGFLIWNWPPAKIFMGDVGSGYLGFVIAVLAIAATRQNPAALWTWLILTALFVVDATVTLVRRLIIGERVYQAHRSHAYQRFARRWGSHRRVTLTVLAIDVLWLLPCAAFAALHPAHAAVTTLVALAPLFLIAVAAGSGRRESPAHTQP